MQRRAVKHEHFIREQVLRGIALNREPGFHFAGNFLDISFDRVAVDDTRLSLQSGPHSADTDGQTTIGALALLADIALAASIRAGLERSTRLATVSLNLHFTGAPRTSFLDARAAFHGFFTQGSGHLGLARVIVRNEYGDVCLGSGSFMVLKPPKDVSLQPMPLRRRGEKPAPLLAEKELKRDELAILRHADAALAKTASNRGAFIRRFWGYEPRRVFGGSACVVTNGPHIGNRVGHVQGGILVGMAAATAGAALPANWALTGISAWYISPGEGETLKAKSKVIHHGRLTAVVRTQVTGRNRRRVLEVVTTHASRPASHAQESK
jgi:acyl-coenzyme A thioesterase PaaI-like protein